MWPFTNKRKDAIQQLSKHISPDVLEEILQHPEESHSAPQQVFIGYNVIQVRDDNVEQLNSQMTKVMDVVFENEGFISDKALSLLVVAFGVPATTVSHRDPAQVSERVAKQLAETFPTDIKVVFGSGEALIGWSENPQYSSYGLMFSSFSQRIEMLCQMDYGSVRKVNL